jgi:hypothetical protein
MRKIDKSLGVFLPAKAPTEPGAEEDRTSSFAANPAGKSYTPQPDESGFDQDMQVAQDLIKRYRETLRMLAN